MSLATTSGQRPPSRFEDDLGLVRGLQLPSLAGHLPDAALLEAGKRAKLSKQICYGTCDGSWRFDDQAAAFYGVIATRKGVAFEGDVAAFLPFSCASRFR